MSTEGTESDRSGPVSRRGFLTVASVSAGASFLASDATAEINAVGVPPGDERMLEETLQATQGALTARAKLAGQMLGAVMQDIEGAIVRSQGDPLKALQSGLAQLLIAAAHSRKQFADARVKSNVQPLAQGIIEAADASPVAVAIATIARDAMSTALAVEVDACIVAGAVLGAVIGAFAGGVGGAIEGAVLGGIVAGGVCAASNK
jgi:hypothetical protein